MLKKTRKKVVKKKQKTIFETEEEKELRELKDMGFKVDLLPDEFKVGGLFILSQYLMVHLGDKKCMLVMNEFENIKLPYA